MYGVSVRKRMNTIEYSSQISQAHHIISLENLETWLKLPHHAEVFTCAGEAWPLLSRFNETQTLIHHPSASIGFKCHGVMESS